jgi:SAM-dependent methyltransferase
MDPVTQGHYYKKQLECKSRVIAWSHRSRFDMALRLMGPGPRKLLDYGCGDGIFLATASGRVVEGHGADITPDQIEDCRVRLASKGNLRFFTVPELAGPNHDGAYDVVTCMETLEHCTEPIVEVVLGDLVRLCAAGGRVIISVPIEIGPSFLLKQAIRTLAGWRGLSDYRTYEPYSIRNAIKMIFAGPSTYIERPVYGDPSSPTHSHYGFNWRRLRSRVVDHLEIERTLFTPVGLLGGWVSSQAWFVCRQKSE